MNELLTMQSLISLVTLTLLEIVLGIDNVIFISILASKLPEHQQARARKVGLFMAMFTRIVLLLSISFIMRLTEPLFHLLHHPVSGRDLILLVGGLFLIGKATYEIHDKLEGAVAEGKDVKGGATFGSVVFQIMILDIVFSLDSVITAVGMAQLVSIMVAAVVIAVAVMMAFAGPVSSFIEKHPTMKILALSFLVLVGFVLMLEGFHKEIPKGYIYFAMAFSFIVEMLNVRMRRRSDPVKLHDTYTA